MKKNCFEQKKSLAGCRAEEMFATTPCLLSAHAKARRLSSSGARLLCAHANSVAGCQVPRDFFFFKV